MAPKSKPKPSPPAAAAESPTIEELFSILNRHVKNFDYDQAVKVADQVLAIAPGDEDAIRCKVAALIKADEIEKALAAILKIEALPIDLNFCKAYCLYRQNKLNEALELLNGQVQTSMVLQLEAQIFYRLSEMDACMESYDKLKNFKIESLELKTNTIAALISAGRSAEVQEMMDSFELQPSISFEVPYNYACSLIEEGKYADAEQQLLYARRIGKEMLMSDGYAEDETEYELAPISVQLAYVHQLLGHAQEAAESYTGMINSNLADPATLAVATNNLIALRGTKDTLDSLRKFDRLIEKTGGAKQFQLASGLDFKLFQRQKEALYANRLLVLLQANKLDQAQELVSVLPEMFPNSITPVLLQAAVHVREKKVPKAEEILGQAADKFPDKSKHLLLARAQIAAAAGHLLIAAESLSRLSDIQHMPATVATIVALKERLSDVNGANAVLDSAIQWWRNTMTEDNKLNLIVQQAASFKLNHGREEEASQLYEELVKSQGSIEALLGLVMTSARTDIEKAELYEKKLRALTGLRGINVESLEKTHGAKQVEGAHVEKMEVSEEVKKGRSKKRKRKPRYPKGFDPANPGPPPDPERWLPKRERSSYRPKRKDKRAQIRGSQGAVSRDKHDAAVANTAGPSTSKAAQGNTSSDSKGGPKNTPSSAQPKGSNRSRKKKH